VTVHYTIDVYVQEHLPAYLLEVGNWYDSTTFFVSVTEPEGTFTVEIPDDAPNGEFGIWADLYDPLTDDHLWSDNTKVVVNSQLSGWDKSVGGMSASDFTILVLIVIMILLLIVMPFLKAKMGAKKEEATPPAPPAEPPKA